MIAFNALVYAFLLAPILVVIALSFTSGQTLAFPPPALENSVSAPTSLATAINSSLRSTITP